MKKEYFKTVMVAEMTGLAERTVRRLAQEDTVKATKINGVWHFTMGSVKHIRRLYR
jgi:hypothetical protein